MSKRAIGIFDSGVGGSSIFKEIHRLLPNENTIYLADSANAPYGEKSPAQIRDLSIKNTEFLIKRGCKIIVVACNTATTNSIDFLRTTYALPFIGIEPAIKPAALQTKTNSIGILATKGTLNSDLFHKTTNLYGSKIKVVEMVGEGLVHLVESGRVDSKEIRELLNKYLQPMINANIDHLVLGCTHYPYLIKIIKEILPANVKIIDSGEAVARQTKIILEQNNLANEMDIEVENVFLSNGNIVVLQELLDQKFQVNFLNF